MGDLSAEYNKAVEEQSRLLDLERLYMLQVVNEAEITVACYPHDSSVERLKKQVEKYAEARKQHRDYSLNIFSPLMEAYFTSIGFPPKRDGSER